MPMDMTVSVKLLDQLSRPAAEAASRLSKFARTFESLTARANGLTRSVRGLSAATQELTATTTAAAHAEAAQSRLRGTLTGLGRAGLSARTGLNAMAGSLDRVAGSADKASAAMRGVVGAGMVASANDQLRQMIALQKQAAHGMRALAGAAGGGGGTGHRRPLMRGVGGHGGGSLPGLIVGFQPNTHDVARSVFEAATSIEQALLRMKGMGFSDADVARVQAQADAVSKANQSTTPLRVMNSILEARSATGGNLNESIRLAPEMARADQVFSRYLSPEIAKRAHDQLYDMVRVGELRNEIGNPERLHRLFENIIATTVYTQGRVSPRDIHKNVLYGRGAAQGWSEDFAENRLGFFVQELKTGPNGGSAGVALQSLFKAVALNVRTKKSNAEWAKLGMLDAAGNIIGANEAITDPDRFLARVHGRMEAIGMREHEEQVKEYGKLFGTGTGQTAAMIGGFQQERLAAYERTRAAVLDSEHLVANANETLAQSADNLHAAIETLTGNVGIALTRTLASLADAAGSAVRALNGIVVVGSHNVNPLDIGLAGAGAILGAGALARRFPLLGRILGGAIGFATGGTGGMFAGSALSGLASRFTAIVGEGAAAGLRGGLVAGAIYDIGRHLVDALLWALPKPAVSPEVQKRIDEDRAGGLSGDLSRLWGDIAGKRASGGPVRRGLTYLVGERGPELFTAGANGAITPNHMLDTMTGTASPIIAAAQMIADAIGRAMRFATFAIITAARDMAGGIAGAFAGRVMRVADAEEDDGDRRSARGLLHRTSYGGTDDDAPRGASRAATSGGMRGRMTAPEPSFGSGGIRDGKAGNLSSNQKEAYASAIKEGLNPTAARALVANMSGESLARPGNKHWDRTHFSQGIVQWDDVRSERIRKQFGKYSKDMSVDEQTRAAIWEMKKFYPRTYKALQGSDPRTMIGALVGDYERPKDVRGQIGVRSGIYSRLGKLGTDGVASKAAPQVPEAVQKPQSQVPDAVREREERLRQEKAAERLSVKNEAGNATTVHVTNHIHPRAEHDEAKIAAMVHKRFNEGVRSQLNDGFMG